MVSYLLIEMIEARKGIFLERAERLLHLKFF